jgi:phospholipase C
MLENRSFDSMLGMLYPWRPDFDGLSGKETNLYHSPDGIVQTISVWNSAGTDAPTAAIPDPDPGELFTDIGEQIFGKGGVPGNQVPPMSGFVDNYMAQKNSADPPPLAASIMHYFTAVQVPVISASARAFGVGDQWHASAPCQTSPNRFFAHTGTAGGYTDNNVDAVPFGRPTIFKRLARTGAAGASTSTTCLRR